MAPIQPNSGGFWSRFTRIFSGSGAKAHDFSGPEPFYDAGFVPRSSNHTKSDGLESNVVMAVVYWIMRTFTEAVAVVERRKDDDIWEKVIDHDLEILIDRPNPSYDGDALLKGTVVSYVLDGNAYWWKLRNIIGDVVELWYLPHQLVRPMRISGSENFIDYYQFTPYAFGSSIPIRIAPRDIVHLRFGLDPTDPMYGLSPLKPLLKEVWSDDEAQSFTHVMLVNHGVPGLLVSPKIALTPKQVDEMKAHVEKYKGEGRGDSLVTGFPADVHEFGFDPNKLNLTGLRDISEERVCAVLGIPAAVVGFGSGLQSTKVGATMAQLVKLAQTQCVIPMQKTIAKQLTAQLLPDFQSQARRFRVRYDRSDVSAFQEEMNLRAEYAGNLVDKGILRIDRAQQLVGVEVDETRKLYVHPSSAQLIDEHGNVVATMKPEPAKPEAPAPTDKPTDPPTDEPDDVPEPVAKRMNGSHA